MAARAPGGLIGACLAALAALVSLLAAAPGAAKTFEPTRKDDPVPNGCKPKNCSLREAVKAANKRDGRDLVLLRKGAYELEIPVGGALEDTGSIDFNDDGILRGQGMGKTTIDANDHDRVINVGADNELGDRITIQGLTVTDGEAHQGTFGGGIQATTFENDRLALQRVAITGNTAQFGGGLHADLRKLTMTNSEVTGNVAGDHGGGIRFGTSSTSDNAEAVVRGSEINGNESPFGGGIYAFYPDLTIRQTTIVANTSDEGGGIDVVGRAVDPPQTTIRSSAISGNGAIKGAGILADGNQPSASVEEPVATVFNSTVAANSASADGGGIMGDNGATVTLDNSTVAHNKADVDNLAGGVAGGIYQHSGAIVGLADSIVGRNAVGSTGTAPECEGSFAGTTGGVVENQPTGSCDTPGGFTTDDAKLGLFDDHGGPTMTVELLSGSPAIGFGRDCPKRDQRGKPRPPAGCDSGSFERRGP